MTQCLIKGNPELFDSSRVCHDQLQDLVELLLSGSDGEGESLGDIDFVRKDKESESDSIDIEPVDLNKVSEVCSTFRALGLFQQFH